jgi:hypothetical protein
MSRRAFKNEKRSGSKSSGDTAVERRKQVLTLIESLPEAAAVPAGGRHLSLEVRGKRFGWFLDDHHGDGRLALNLKAARGVGDPLIAKAPDRFYVPKYIGHHGWIGVWLDCPAQNWNEIGKLIKDAYLRTAPKGLATVLSSTARNEKACANNKSWSPARAVPSAVKW